MEQFIGAPFGDMLRGLRKRRRLTQSQLAEQLGVHLNTIGGWERGLKLPGSKSMVLEVARHLRLTEQEIRQLLEASLTALSPPWNVPYQRNPFFTGREEILYQLAEALSHKQAVALTQAYALHGLGGIGKTQIAVEYAYRHALDYSAVFWIGAETPESIIASWEQIAQLLDLPQSREQNQSLIVAAVHRWLSTHQGWLLIWDNIEDLDLLARFLPASREGSLLLTTRHQALGTLARGIPLLPLTPEESTLLLLRRSKILSPAAGNSQLPQVLARHPEEEAAVRTLTELMGGLPLALDQVGAYVEETQCGLEDYLRGYHQRRSHLLERRGQSHQDHPASIQTTLSLSFQQVQQRSPAAAEILQLCAFFAPDAIPEELLTLGFPPRSEHLQTIATDPWLLDEAIAVLGTYSLVRRDPTTKTLSLHRLVQAVVQAGLSKQEQEAWIRHLISVLNQVFPTESQQMTRWPWCEQLVPHVMKVLIPLEQGADPLETSSLLYKTASYFHNRARYLEAMCYHQQALDLREQLLGPDHEGLVEPLIGLVEATWYLKTYTSTAAHAQRVIGILERTQGTNHFALIKPLNIWAHVYRVQGQFAQAERLLVRGLSIWIATILREVNGLDYSPDRATSQEGEKQDVEMLIHQALSLWEQAPQRHHDPIGQALSALSHVYQQQHRYEEAEQILVPLQQLGKQALGEKHHILANSLMILVEVYKGQGRLVEAEQCCFQALTIREQALGSQHPLTIETHTVYATLSRATDKSLDSGV